MQSFYVKEILFRCFPSDLVEMATNWKPDLTNDNIPKPEYSATDFPDAPKWLIHEIESVLEFYLVLICHSEATLKAKYEAIKSSTYESVVPFPKNLGRSDYLYWVRKPRWNREQATLLSMGLIPTGENIRNLSNIFRYDSESLPPLVEYLERHNLYNSACRAGELEFDEVFDSQNLGGESLYPGSFLRWAERLELSLPDGLSETFFKFNPAADIRLTKPSKEMPNLTDVEKDSLLKLVAGMAIGGYRFDPTAGRNDATSDIQGDLDELGIGLDQKTILKWLRKASDVLPK